MTDTPRSVFDFEARTLQGESVGLDCYRGKVLLLVNTASNCGFTPQYRDLEELYQRYRERGLVVLAFPCNQFGQQEPGSAADIAQFCSTRFALSFPLFDKLDVNGPQAHPLFTFLKEAAPGILGSTAIKWNFTKFLVDRNGKVQERFAPIVPPNRMIPSIERLLDESPSAQ
ncbi:glutathione peroxidase [Lacisediminimonas profundi]|uniref:glutathione peroxidase n=1 Tax=Lacisediminimonas profundi TaxID=2603856 RepID=UPI00124B4746|nr:glutathione peroxidase [Lacisediminimonas profundi]